MDVEEEDRRSWNHNIKEWTRYSIFTLMSVAENREWWLTMNARFHRDTSTTHDPRWGLRWHEIVVKIYSQCTVLMLRFKFRRQLEGSASWPHSRHVWPMPLSGYTRPINVLVDNSIILAYRFSQQNVSAAEFGAVFDAMPTYLLQHIPQRHYALVCSQEE